MSTRITLCRKVESPSPVRQFVFFCGGEPGPGQWFQASLTLCVYWPHRCPTVEVTGRPSLPVTSEFLDPSL